MDPRLAERVTRQEVLARASAEILGVDVPYFAHLRVRIDGRERDILFGRQTRACGDATLVDWRSSVWSEALFGEEEGEELRVGEAPPVTAMIVERNWVDFAGGALVELSTPELTLSRRGTGAWTSGPRTRPVRLPRVEARRDGIVDVELDAAQRRVIDLPPGRSVLVLGEAGHGKTTVALHRLAALRRSAAPGFRAAVVVPTEGLRALIESSLGRLGIYDVEVWLYERWAARQARRVFSGIPRRESQGASSAVVRLKRHPAVRRALETLAARDDDDPARAGVEEVPRSRSRAARDRPRRDDLLHLFGDRALLEEAAAASDGALTASMIGAVLEHTHVQFSETAEEEFAHVDTSRLVTLDGRSIDDDTPMGDAQTIDAEDYAVLFELDRLRARRRGGRPVAPRPYDCIVLDEAQELAPLELALIGRSVSKTGCLIVAGDADQQVDPAAFFEGWDRTMEALGAPDHDRAVLEMGYRCPPGVTRIARSIRSGWSAQTTDGSVSVAPFPSECHLLAWLADELRELREEGLTPRLVAVIARTPEGARDIARALRRGLGVRLVLDGQFGAHRGAVVTSVREVKGLEFDQVVVPDASGASYPDTPESRRALYVAATRAIHQLVLATGAGLTDLLRTPQDRHRTEVEMWDGRP